MLFNSVAFAFFFPCITLLYFMLPHRHRWWLLLVASCGFYMWFRPEYILILGFTIVVDYWAGIWIEQSAGARRRWALVASLAANIGVLAVFKYWNFGHANLAALADAAGWKYPIPLLEIVLPIGLSFHTFQAMSYTIEVYRGVQKAERHFGIYALYVMFYPQLVAGPIERPQNLLVQFREEHVFDYGRVVSGARLMAWGLFKKVCIADRLAPLVNAVYAAPSDFGGPWVVLATFFFAYQIYCDFSGYSDIAIGSARVMGFRLMKNFNRPYEARTIGEFWRRWHMSLSTWFRDYVYIPAGGNRVSAGRRNVNLFIVFLLSGLWHGANWTFIVWGALHGAYLICGSLTDRARAAWRPAVERWLGTTALALCQRTMVFVLVCIGWVFFRAADFERAGDVFSAMLTGWHNLAHPLSLAAQNGHTDVSRRAVLIGLFFLSVLFAVHALERRRPLQPWLDSLAGWQRWWVYSALIGSMVFLSPDSGDQFIYFQF
jgi:alginate O-acetyltransferase complex protein AlgI